MRKLLTVLAALLVIAVIGIGVLRWQSTNQSGGGSGSSGSSRQDQAAPPQPADCPEVEFLAAPGTWESAKNDDPLNPTANPQSLMLKVTGPLQQAVDPARVKVWTLPYTAQFRNINAQDQMSYDDSREEGTATFKGELSATHQRCPQTDFVLAGFSQGAVIAGDIANAIGLNQGPVPAERVRGVALIADGRREAGVGQFVGNPVAGVGAEVALQPLSLVIQPIVPGATMRGPRQGGFGQIDDRVTEICAPDDTICDAPRGASDGIGRAQQLVSANGVHAQYATNPNVIPGSTATEWLLGWAKDMVQLR